VAPSTANDADRCRVGSGSVLTTSLLEFLSSSAQTARPCFLGGSGIHPCIREGLSLLPASTQLLYGVDTSEQSRREIHEQGFALPAACWALTSAPDACDARIRVNRRCR